MIRFEEDLEQFILETKNYSYHIEILNNKYLRHIQWGRKIPQLNRPCSENDRDLEYTVDIDFPNKVFIESHPLEFGIEGSGDFRRPSVSLNSSLGRPFNDLEYFDYKINKGKKKLIGLPSSRYNEGDLVETLSIFLKDPESKVLVELLYSVFDDYDVITRSMNISNTSNEAVDINSIMSFSLDIPSATNGEDLGLISLEGSWARERHIERGPLRKGKTTISSNRGISSHILNPFCCLAPKSTTEFIGESWSFSLIYSGNFMLEMEKSFTNNIRVSGGINPENFSWTLEENSSFQTPEAILVYSDEGLNGMSNIYHKFLRDRLLPKEFGNSERPILINNWESTYFDFDHDKIISISKKAKEVGIELCVLDDGWFGDRDGDTKGLGNWSVNKDKLPKGLEGLSSEINQNSMKFGLWVEPEMVNDDAKIIKEHPDWLLGAYKENPVRGRNQLVLDLANPEVVDWLIETFTDVFSWGNISYIKWDMNRSITEQFSEHLPPKRKKESSHRYVLGLYRLMDTLVTKFPKILFEGCSGGGGRFDPGILFYMPQYWTSDNTDGIARLKIQYGTSLVYPIITMGAHVSVCPNHQLNRVTPMNLRLNAAMSGNLGFELDLNDIQDSDLKIVKEGIDFYKKHRPLIQLGEFYRLRSPYNGELTSWMFINREKTEFILFWFVDRGEISYYNQFIKLPYVDENKNYRDIDEKSISGRELKFKGVKLPMLNNDNSSGYFYFNSK
ncbi:alpha-galactosidase [Thiospirochaeta perfilievii]|uniref:Alpha-galactosidase n=1 Tax=Thiospirochaeta perfilievii TaxID=252967 RepID=A0A5C1Q9T2_9SPIO|nr:alpha-galactosidase [Thiospirochaeta perfilievii]QEN04241.1 alpha-galactosidase [Thiospirochaeta perfilievii]